MMTFSDLTSLSLPAARALVHFLWQGLAVALVAAVILVCMRRARPGFRYAVALGALVVMASMPILTVSSFPSAERLAEIRPNGDQVWVSLRLGSHHHFGTTLPRRAVRELPDGSAEIRREAGTVHFHGGLSKTGRFTFTPSPEYLRALADRGLHPESPAGESLFELAMIASSTAYAATLGGASCWGSSAASRRTPPIQSRRHRWTSQPCPTIGFA